jgi:hypothetical protein
MIWGLPPGTSDRSLFVPADREAAGCGRESHVFDSILIDDSVQCFDGAAQIRNTPVERVDLVF